MFYVEAFRFLACYIKQISNTFSVLTIFTTFKFTTTASLPLAIIVSVRSYTPSIVYVIQNLEIP